jgi:hypothetical protein
MSDGDLRAIFRRRLPSFDWLSIETALTEAGVPDSNFCCNGVEGFIEHKRTMGWTVPLRPAQVGWILRRTRAGGRVFIAVRRMSVSRRPADELWLIHGWAAKEAKAGGLKKLPRLSLIGCWEGGPGAWPWDRVAAALTGDGSWNGRHPSAKD